jgi:hypothetical protein
MQEMMLGHQREREMEFAVRRSSIDRSWSGFKATIYDTTEGFAENPMFGTHMFSSAETSERRCDAMAKYCARYAQPGIFT